MSIIPKKWFRRKKVNTSLVDTEGYRQIELVLAKEEELYREALRLLADTYRIALLDLRTGISHYIKADEEELKSLGLPGTAGNKDVAYEEWVRRASEELVHPDYREEFALFFDIGNVRNNMGKGHSRQMLVYRCRDKAGGVYRWEEAAFVACGSCGRGGSPEKAMLYIRDISDKQTAERERRRELEKALDRVKRKERANADIVEYISHDLRASMNAIAGMNEIALRTLEADRPEMTKHYISMVKKVANSAMSFLSEVLDISNMQKMGMALTWERFDIHDLATACGDYFHYLAPGSGISFIWVGELQGLYLGDEHRIKQVLFNLIENAVKFNRAGGVIKIEVDKESDVNMPMSEDQHAIRPCGSVQDRFTICIRDTGDGIAPEKKQHLFEPFLGRCHGVFDLRGGMGAGLGVAKYILDTMGGTIHVRSELGAGTEVTVQFTLPRAVETSSEMRGDLVC